MKSYRKNKLLHGILGDSPEKFQKETPENLQVFKEELREEFRHCVRIWRRKIKEEYISKQGNCRLIEFSHVMNPEWPTYSACALR